DKYKDMQNSETNYGTEEAGMAQLDDIVGSVLKYLKDNGLEENTIVVFTTDNGAEVFTWPDGGMTPFRNAKGSIYEGGFRVPALMRWPGKVPAGKVENGLISGLDWFPTLVAAAGNDKIAEELKEGKKLGDREYKVYLDGYNQMDLITGKGPSKRHEIFYFAEDRLGALRIDEMKFRFIDQPDGWAGPKVGLNMPTITNLGQDPFERTQDLNINVGAPGYFDQFMARE
ncbi:MAG TPA: sulfatase-like hydrolase/transferase, partial [Candidatus Berkiella sp.]|nr:sulfatase-like hydrolase/transferase [Candidatus Berkiella sp.]